MMLPRNFESSRLQPKSEPAAPKTATGPVTDAGKQIVAANAVKHGLAGSAAHACLPGERAAFDQHTREFLEHFRPVGPEETARATNLASNYWRLRRAHAMEAALFEQVILEKEGSADSASAQAQAWIDKTKGLQRISTYAARIQRELDKDAAALEALQKARKAAYAKAEEEAVLLTKLAHAKGETFDPAAHFASPEDCGGFVYSTAAIARVIERHSRLEEARQRFNPAPATAAAA